MSGLSEKNFGIAIGYVLPGFVLLYGASTLSPMIGQWIAAPPSQPRLSGLLFVLFASLGVGLVVSAFRWLVIDQLHHATGIQPPQFDFSKLVDRLDAFDALVISHYRYYQFYANLFVALPISVVLNGLETHGSISMKQLVAFVSIELILFLGSRDSLAKYYRRSEALLQHRPVIVSPTSMLS